jgi:hypothetical protein
MVDEKRMIIMNRRDRDPRWLAAILGLAILGFAAPQTLMGQSPDIGPNVHAPRNIALLVTTSDLLFDIESFGGGIGLKVGHDSSYLRFMLDIFLSTASNGFSIELGTTYEHHFSPGPISPYWALAGSLGFETEKDKTNSLNWSLVQAVPLSVEGLLGVELFLTDNVSLFLEYALSLEVLFVHSALSVEGSTFRDTSVDFVINAGLANQTEIGVTIYFPPAALPKRLKKQQSNSRI